MAALCREFDVSRKTGYKIFQRYKDCGLEGLTDRSRRPYRQANQLPFQVEKLIVQLKRERPSWGAPKIREKLRRSHSDIPTPAISAVHAVLDRHGLVNRGRKRRYRAQGTSLSKPRLPNDLWCADYKGEFMLVDRRYGYPLTISVFASRYLLSCEALSSTKDIYAFTVFERVLKGASCAAVEGRTRSGGSVHGSCSERAAGPGKQGSEGLPPDSRVRDQDLPGPRDGPGKPRRPG